jgi:hypothetical protein
MKAVHYHKCRNCGHVSDDWTKDFTVELSADQKTRVFACNKCKYKNPSLARISSIPAIEDLVKKYNIKAHATPQGVELARRMVKEMAMRCLDEASYISSYNGHFSKVEVMASGQDELCDKIEEAILRLKSKIK